MVGDVLEGMPEERVAEKRWKWRIEGTRPRGRPRGKREDGMEERLKEHNLPSSLQSRETGKIEARLEWIIWMLVPRIE